MVAGKVVLRICTNYIIKMLNNIRHLHISHDAQLICVIPKFFITFDFHFSWVLQPSQEKLKTMLMQIFGGVGVGVGVGVGGQISCIVGYVQVAYLHRRSGYIAVKRHRGPTNTSGNQTRVSEWACFMCAHALSQAYKIIKINWLNGFAFRVHTTESLACVA